MFQITPAGTVTTLYSFCSQAKCADGKYPYGGLTLGTDGNFHGTTYNGGAYDDGTVFKVTPAGGLTVLYSFRNGTDGAFPWSPPIEGTDGNFYGVASQYEGKNGSVYKITPSGKFTLLYYFDGTHGRWPFAPLVQGIDGSFYGTTDRGGSDDLGVVFKITRTGKITVLHSFSGSDGQYADGGLLLASDGHFYGTTSYGGKYSFGVVYRISPGGRFAVVHNMQTKGGYRSAAGLTQATDDKIYGLNGTGGQKDHGTIFSFSPSQPYAYKDVHNFVQTMGAQPSARVLQHTNGILYGDTYTGGSGEVSPCRNLYCGVFYSLNVGLGPFVSLVSTSGKVGSTVEILGQGFTGTTGVSFNGTVATFNVSSDTYLTATVPNGATTGFVTVTTPGGTLTSNQQFRVTTRSAVSMVTQ